MADYHPLISRAVAGLDKNTSEARRVLYDRARNALVAQLRAIQPPLEEDELTRERLELEEAIRKVEAEQAQKAASAPATSAPATPGSPVGSAASTPPRPDSSRPSPPPVRRPPAPPASERTQVNPPAPREPASTASSSSPRPRPPDRPSLTSEALKGFRDVVPDKAKFSDSEPPPAPFTPTPRDPPNEPYRAPRDVGPGPRRDLNGLRATPSGREHAPLRSERDGPVSPQSAGFGDHEQEPRSARTGPTGEHDRWRPGVHEPVNPETYDFPQSVEGEEEVHRPRRSYAALIGIVIAVLLISGLGAGGYYAASRPGGIMALVGLAREQPAQPVQREAAAPTRGKITDRVGAPSQSQQQQAGLPQSSTTTAAPVAQRVVLYEDDPANPQGKQYVGTAVWRTEMVSPGPGLAPEMAVRADVEIPERRLRMTWSLRRNTDQNLPASHTIEIMFNLPADFPHGGIANVPGIMMKQAESTRGVALAGLAVKVTSGYFLIGLSAVESDLQRNVQLLKERAWFDIPVLYDDNRRAILALEKGNPGERAFAEAFTTWVQ
jgi:hypothetical protein